MERPATAAIMVRGASEPEVRRRKKADDRHTDAAAKYANGPMAHTHTAIAMRTKQKNFRKN